MEGNEYPQPCEGNVKMVAAEKEKPTSTGTGEQIGP